MAAAELKAAGEVGKILVTGCLSQRYQADILVQALSVVIFARNSMKVMRPSG